MTIKQAHVGPILIVDDEPEARRNLAGFLTACGYRVIQAEDGREALQHLRQGPCPRLIILDLMMPTMDGWEFRREQRNDPALADIPILVLTQTPLTVSQAWVFQVDDYLVKPYDEPTLRHMVSRYCKPENSRFRQTAENLWASSTQRMSNDATVAGG